MANVAIKPLLKYIDDSFPKRKDQERLHLSIEMSVEQVVYAIIDKQSNEYLVLEVYPLTNGINFQSAVAEFSQIVDHSDILKNWKSSSSLAINHNYATIIPNPIFNEKKTSQYLTVNFELNADDYIYYDDLTNVKAKNVFSLSREVHTFFSQQFKGITFHHHSTSLIEPLFLQHKNRSAPLVIVNVQKSDFQLIILENKSLRLYNSYHYQNEDEFVYFVLFVFEQLKLDASKNEVLLTGQVDENTVAYKKLATYVKHIEFDFFQPVFGSTKPSEPLGRNYFSIFNQYMCVS